jgi:ATP/maltotriose-dependent transcriptional regulator MalT
MGAVSSRVASETFVGRSAELAVLDGALERGAAGVPAFAFVAGESGVGKSRLVAEFEARARAAGAEALVGHCLELGGTVFPYAPLVDALRPVARELALCGSELRDSLPPEATEALAELIPEFGDEHKGGPRRAPEERPGRQARLFEALLALLDKLSALQPLALVFEDLHWADPSTRDFLVFLVRNARSEHLAVVVTYRSDELHRRHPLRPVLAELERASGVDRVGLERFTRDEVAEQLAGILDGPAPEELVDRLYARSEGNPLYTEELLAASADGSGALPATLRDALLGRFERLPDAGQDVVRLAAVIDRPMRHELLAEASSLPPGDLMAGAREAVANQVLVIGAEGTYAFRHALVGEAVYGDLLPGERTALHASVAAALDDEPELLGDVPAATVEAERAFHWQAAHDLPRAVGASVQAGRAAARVFAYSEALRHFERALELWDRVPDAEQRAGCDRVAILRKAADMASYAGHSARALALVREALAVVDPEADALRAARLHAQRGKLLWQGAGETDESLEAYETAMALLPPDEPLELAGLQEQQATSFMLRGRFASAVELAARAAAAAAEHEDPALESRAVNIEGISRAGLGELEEGLRLLRRARELAAAHGSPADHVRAVINLSETLDLSGRTEEALGEVRAMLALTRSRPEVSSYDTFLALNEVTQLIRLGRTGEAMSALPGDVPGDAAGATAIYLHEVRARLALLRGERDELAAELESMRRLCIGTREPQWLEPLESMTAQLALRDGEVEAARTAVERGFDALRDTDEGARVTRMAWIAAMVEAQAAERARALGEEPDAAALDAVAARIEAAEALPGQWAEGPLAAQLARAELAQAQGIAPEVAAVRFVAVAESFDRLRWPAPAAYARVRAAECLVTAGDRNAAAVPLAAACTAARAMGAAWIAGDAEALARRARIKLEGPAEEAPAGEPESPAERLGLTPRELEVLLLVAEGRTNREIGATLFMSEKTASVHVSRILAKLDVGGRVEAAAVAHRLGLTSAT